LVTEDQQRGHHHAIFPGRFDDSRPLDFGGIGELRSVIYLFGVVKGQHLPAWPVFVVGDDPSDLCFKVAIDEQRLALAEPTGPADRVAEARRSYVTILTLRRLHQETFRQRVLRAYRENCAICHLRHAELLEAAHILPDGHPRGEPVVPNGVALCKLHHAAFDRHILGITPQFIIEVRRDILEEVDGPMLRHGLQEIAGQRINLPSNHHLWPRADFLEERYEMFRKAS
jgi:putative restriction endonuclease